MIRKDRNRGLVTSGESGSVGEQDTGWRGRTQI